MSADPGYYYEKGTRDGHDRDYDPPHGMFDELVNSPSLDHRVTENRAYDNGYFFARGQDDCVDNDYDPPSDSDDKEAYDEGWESVKNNDD